MYLGYFPDYARRAEIWNEWRFDVSTMLSMLEFMAVLAESRNAK